MAKKTEKSWHGRLTAQADKITAELLASIDIDKELWKYDIAGSIAHAQMLSEQRIITKKDFSQIKSGLLKVADMLENHKLELSVELEDIHMVIEKALIDTIGPVGGKLHTGRSRNDQTALDLRLWARDAADNLADALRVLQGSLVGLAEKYDNLVIPAYTHLQRAQPVLAGHTVLAYGEMFQRDIERLIDARKRINICPLGSGAVAGTSIPLDRNRTAALLGFDSITRNSIDATSDRDFLTELCFACAMIGVHLSRMAEDWIIYSTTEFAMLTLHDAYCTSSSMMPQKKNADTLELIRGKSATAISQLVGMLTLIKGLPLAYNRDLQDDKRFVMPSVKAMMQALAVMSGIVSTTKFNVEKINSDIEAGFLDATALAEYITNKGVPFRTAHHIVGQLVAKADAQNIALAELPMEVMRSYCDKISADVQDHLHPANVVKNYSPQGAGGKTQLARQLAFWKNQLGQ